MRVLVCGSREFTDRLIIWSILDGLLAEWKDAAEISPVMKEDEEFILIEGGAKGADTIAAEWAERNGITHWKFSADWEVWGKAAGPLRNRRMLEEGRPTEVFAFVNKPLAQSRGTADMVKVTKQSGIPAYVIEQIS